MRSGSIWSKWRHGSKRLQSGFLVVFLAILAGLLPATASGYTIWHWDGEPDQAWKTVGNWSDRKEEPTWIQIPSGISDFEGLPGPPTDLTAVGGNRQATVTFTAPADDGGSPITSYTVTSNPGNISQTGAVSPITVTGLSNGTAYTFTATATNGSGTGPASSPSNSVTPATVPGAPTGAAAVAGDGQATVSFNAPADDGGSPITSYTVTSNPGNISQTGTASPITVTGLINGMPYNFTVKATNGVGTGPASAPTNSVIPTPFVVTAPKGGEVWEAGSKVTISWTYTGNPGPKVRVELLKGGAVASVIDSSIRVGDGGQGAYEWKIPIKQTPGTDYRVRISSVTSPAFTAMSQDTFTIPGPALTVTSPNGGEKWVPGGNETITWTYSGNTGEKVRVELLKAGVVVKRIVKKTGIGQDGEGSYSWTVPKKRTPGDDYKVRITSTKYGTVTDESDADFSIGPESVLSCAGPDQRVQDGEVTWLSGSNSIGSAEKIAAYRWIQTDGSPVDLSDPAVVEPAFVAPAVGPEGESLAFQLVLTGKDGSQSDDSCIVNITSDNNPPTADAGSNRIVTVGEIVTLDGSQSTDPDDGIATYLWQQVEGRDVELTDPSAVSTTFVAPEVGPVGETLIFRLTVTDHGGLRSRATCLVNDTLENQPPKAHAGSNQTVQPGAAVTLDGSKSMDPEESVLSFRWTQTTGEPVTLSDPTAVQSTFLAPVIKAGNESLVFQLMVTDGGGLVDKERVTVFIE